MKILILTLLMSVVLITLWYRNRKKKIAKLATPIEYEKFYGIKCYVDPTKDMYFIDLSKENWEVKTYEFKYNKKDHNFIINDDGYCYLNNVNTYYLVANDLDTLKQLTKDAIDFITEHYVSYQIPPIKIEFVNECEVLKLTGPGIDLDGDYNFQKKRKRDVHISRITQVSFSYNKYEFTFKDGNNDYKCQCLEPDEVIKFDPDRHEQSRLDMISMRAKLYKSMNDQLINMFGKQESESKTIYNLKVV